jgi:hypothetical protein
MDGGRERVSCLITRDGIHTIVYRSREVCVSVCVRSRVWGVGRTSVCVCVRVSERVRGCAFLCICTDRRILTFSMIFFMAVTYHLVLWSLPASAFAIDCHEPQSGCAVCTDRDSEREHAREGWR